MPAAKVGILGQAAPAAGVTTDLYTVPAARRAAVSSLIACNTTNVPTTIRVHARINGAAVGVGNAVVYDVDLDAKGRYGFVEGLTVDDADIISVRSVDGGITFTLCGTEEDNI